MKRILNYPGSKWKMADVIINIMPTHETYVEPFFGSGAVFFNKPKSEIETINDIDSRVVNFFKICRDSLDDLVDKLEMTPHSREEYRKSYEVSDDLLEDARRFTVRMWQAFGAKTSDSTGWRSTIEKGGSKPKEWDSVPIRIKETAKRLKGAQIENQDAIELLKRYNRKTTLTYVDPPYLLETRSKRLYAHEYSVEDHEALLNMLVDFKGKVILSGYESDLYNDRLDDWYKVYFDVTAELGTKRREVLWCNFKPAGQIDLLEI